MRPISLPLSLHPTGMPGQPIVAYLWLVWYDAPSKASPKHWSLAVTYETNERAYATFYEVRTPNFSRFTFPDSQLTSLALMPEIDCR